MQSGSKPCHQQINQRNKRCNNHNKRRNTHFIRNRTFYEGYYNIGHGQHKSRGQPHTQTVYRTCRCSQCGTHPQQQHKYGVLFYKPFNKILPLVHFIFPPFCNVLYALSNASQNALELIVAAVMASTSPPSFFTISFFCAGLNP